MYDVALPVAACVRAGTRVDVAWAVAAELPPGSPDPVASAEAVALTPGGGRIGGLLGGALDGALTEVASAHGPARSVTVELGDLEAQASGLPGGGRVRCLVSPASDLPAELWDRLSARERICLASRVEPSSGTVAATTLHHPEPGADGPDARAAELLERGTSGRVVTDDLVLTVLCPVPTLVVLGGGPVADALASLAPVLGWRARLTTDPEQAAGLAAGLAAPDMVVVAGHDTDAAGRVLAAALTGAAGYVGSLGPQRLQDERRRWLADRGFDDLDRVHGPAGLDLRGGEPAEIALAIAAEAVAARHGSPLAVRPPDPGQGNA